MNKILKTKGTFSASAWISLLLVCSVVFFRFVYPPINILSWDVFGYYLYLPATFIYHDLRLADISWVQRLIEQYQATSTFYQATPLPAGGWVMKYSMGMAVLNAPGFFIAHLFSYVAGYKTDGFSLPYQYAWAISGLVYSAIGIVMLRKILLAFFDETITSILLVITVLATNYFQLTAFDGYLSHNYLFTLYTLIVWLTLRWHRQPGWKYATGLGFAMGLAVLVRPSELVCILIPVLWGIHNSESFRQKIMLIKSNYKQLILLILAVFVTGFPQLLYWKYSSGHWLFYSYNNAGEGFDFGHPYLKEVLFSFRKGWFIYTPVMMFAMAGFISLFKRNQSLFYTILVYFVVNLYIVSSWTCWWYAGGSYSQRALLSSYVLLVLPMGYLLKEVQSWNKVLRILIFSITGLLLLLNIFQTWQWAHGLIDRTRMSREYYFAIFAKTAVTEADRKLLLVERPAEAFVKLTNEADYIKRTASSYDFESKQDEALTLSFDTVHSGKAALRLDNAHPFSPGYEAEFEEITHRDHAWIRAGVWVFPLKEVKPGMASLVITFEHNGGSYNYNALGIELAENPMQPGKWNYISMDYLTPEVRSVHDKVKAYFWLQGQDPVYIDDFTIEIFEPRQAALLKCSAGNTSTQSGVRF
ncbi:MAG: hypothetical protein WCR72_16140 [Bacteroidota bacterium]